MLAWAQCISPLLLYRSRAGGARLRRQPTVACVQHMSGPEDPAPGREPREVCERLLEAYAAAHGSDLQLGQEHHSCCRSQQGDQVLLSHCQTITPGSSITIYILNYYSQISTLHLLINMTMWLHAMHSLAGSNHRNHLLISKIKEQTFSTLVCTALCCRWLLDRVKTHITALLQMTTFTNREKSYRPSMAFWLTIAVPLFANLYDPSNAEKLKPLVMMLRKLEVFTLYTALQGVHWGAIRCILITGQPRYPVTSLVHRESYPAFDGCCGLQRLECLAS